MKELSQKDFDDLVESLLSYKTKSLKELDEYLYQIVSDPLWTPDTSHPKLSDIIQQNIDTYNKNLHILHVNFFRKDIFKSRHLGSEINELQRFVDYVIEYLKLKYNVTNKI
jgi:hypothetical protein